MHYFFFDAAGDPGFKVDSGSSPFYVVCVISTSDKYGLQDKLEQLRKTFKASPKYEFKYFKFPALNRRLFFTEIMKHDLRAHVCVIDKANSFQVAMLSKLGGNALTNRIIAPLISHAIDDAEPPITNFHFYIDQAKHDKKIAQVMRAEISHELNQRKLSCISKLSPQDSKIEHCLQIADMIAGMVMDSYETGDKKLLNIVKPKLVLMPAENIL